MMITKFNLYENHWKNENYWRVELEDAVASCCRDYVVNTEAELDRLIDILIDKIELDKSKSDFDIDVAKTIVKMYIEDNIDEWKYEIEDMINKNNHIKDYIIDYIYDEFSDSHDISIEDIEEYYDEYLKDKQINKFKI